MTLSANLDGVGSLRSVDAMSVIQRAQMLPQPVPLDAARELGTTLVLVTHEPDLAARAGRVIRLHDGALVYDSAAA